MKVCELYKSNPEATRFGLKIKGLATGVEGVLIPPFDDDFDATSYFFHKEENKNGFGHFFFKDCQNEVVLNSFGEPVYCDLPDINF